MKERKTVLFQPRNDKTSELKAAINFNDATIDKSEKESVENTSIWSSFKKEDKHYQSHIRFFIYDEILMNVPTASTAPPIKSLQIEQSNMTLQKMFRTEPQLKAWEEKLELLQDFKLLNL